MTGLTFDASIDLYAVLDVPANAAQERIKRRFRELARSLHPDVNHSPDAEQQFKRVASAYEVLGDPAARSAYDRARAEWICERDERERRERELPLRWAAMRTERPEGESGPRASERVCESWCEPESEAVLLDPAQYQRLLRRATVAEAFERCVHGSFVGFIAIAVRALLGAIEVYGPAPWLFYPRALLDGLMGFMPLFFGLHQAPLAWGITAGLVMAFKDRGLKPRRAVLKSGLAAYERFCRDEQSTAS